MDMVERVTKAIEAAMDAGSPTGWAGEFEVADLARAAIAAMNDVEPELLFKPRPMTSFIASLPKDKLAKLKNYSGSENHGEAQPLLP